MRIKGLFVSLTIICFLSIGPQAFTAESTPGRIIGRVFDADSKAPIEKVTVVITATEATVLSDDSGQFQFDGVTPGQHSLTFIKGGYRVSTVDELEVKAGEATELEFPLPPLSEADLADEDIFDLDEFVVKANVIEGSRASLDLLRQRSAASINALSADEIARFNASDAAEAVARVAGISVVEGEFAVIRGLGDRYGNTLLNGVGLPTPDPDRNAVQLDLFPSGILESIVVSKTFTPDQPGDTSGGSVNLKTKSIVEEEFLVYKFSTGFNDNAFGGDYISYDTNGNAQNYARGVKDRESVGGPLSTAPITEDDHPLAPDFKFGLEYGNSFKLKNDNILGFVLGLNYSLTSKLKEGFFENRQPIRFQRGFFGNPDTPSDFISGNLSQSGGEFDLIESEEDVTLAGLGGLTFKTEDHQVGFTGFIVQKGIDVANQRANGRVPEGLQRTGDITNFDPTEVFFRDFLQYRERNLSTGQFTGEHQLSALNDGILEWAAAYTQTSQEEPDLRETFYIFDEVDDKFKIQSASDFGTPIRRTWRDIEEEQISFDFDYEHSFEVFYERELTLKWGALYSKAEREVDQTDINVTAIRDITADSPEGLFDDPSLFSNAAGFPSFADTERKISAGYWMSTLQVFDNLKLVGGFRLEKTDLSVEGEGNFPPTNSNDFYRAHFGVLNIDPDAGSSGEIDQYDWLPSINLIYDVTDSVVLRLSASQTIARPSFRELSPYFSSDPSTGGDRVIGNPQLEISDVTNLDARIEWHTGSGGLLATSIFSKRIQDPIEKVNIYDGPRGGYFQSWRNNPNTATIEGIEVECRQNLGFLHPELSVFTVGANFTYIDAAVDIPEQDRIAYVNQRYYPSLDQVPEDRRLFDQPEWIVNADITYTQPAYGLEATLALFAISDVLTEPGAVPSGSSTQALFDQYEDEYLQLDFTLSKTFGNGWKFKFALENITDSKRGVLYDPDITNGDIYQTRYTIGRTYSFSVEKSF